MGILRTILALAVVVYHSYKIFGLKMCGGQVAVETFYMISGFYMALILNEKYTGVGHYKKFITSRFIRIFPVYWIILILAVMLSVVGYVQFDKAYYLTRYINNYNCLSGITILYFVLENVIVIGQDVLYFLKMDTYCNPILTYNVLSFKHTGYQYLFVPQAWTISIEFMFYLLAPFLVTKILKWQLLIIALGFLFKFYCFNWMYLSFDPWTYRFFPFELPYFMMGSIAYKYYNTIKSNYNKSIGILMLLISVLSILFYEFIPGRDHVKSSVFYLFVFIAIPFVFVAFKNNKIDRYIGEFSFSLYISHHIMVSILRGYFFSNPHYLMYYGYAVVLSSLSVAFLLQITIIKYIESYRTKRFS